MHHLALPEAGAAEGLDHARAGQARPAPDIEHGEHDHPRPRPSAETAPPPADNSWRPRRSRSRRTRSTSGGQIEVTAWGAPAWSSFGHGYSVGNRSDFDDDGCRAGRRAGPRRCRCKSNSRQGDARQPKTTAPGMLSALRHLHSEKPADIAVGDRERAGGQRRAEPADRRRGPCRGPRAGHRSQTPPRAARPRRGVAVGEGRRRRSAARTASATACASIHLAELQRRGRSPRGCGGARRRPGRRKNRRAGDLNGILRRAEHRGADALPRGQDLGRVPGHEVREGGGEIGAEIAGLGGGARDELRHPAREDHPVETRHRRRGRAAA